MSSHKSEFLNIVKERGFLHQCTNLDGLDEVLSEERPVSAYIGFDCTAPSLHVGNLMQIMILRWLQKCGHRPIVLIGGATTRIGDPSGKTTERPALSDAVIHANMAGIQTKFARFIRFGDSGNEGVTCNNSDWMDSINLLSFMRNYGRHFSINRMLSMDSVKLRLSRAESEMSLLEFNYMIMQAYDFVELHRILGCRLQIGGSDQWGNIVGGVDLHRRLMAKENEGKQNIYDELFGLTTPLITTASGTKMGKSESGAVWLNADMFSPFDYWQFWRNTEDGDVGRFLRLFTELPLEEIGRLEQLQGAEINEAKKILATTATALCHGEAAANAAAETARKTFEHGGAGESLKIVLLDRAQLDGGIAFFELLHIAGLKESKTEARKLVEGGGAKINDEKICDPKFKVTPEQLTDEGHIKLSAGKKQHLLIKLKTFS